MYVSDHVEAYLLAMKNDTQNEVFNVAPGKGISNKELSLKIAELIGFDSNNIIFGSYPQNYPFRPLASDQPYIILDSSKIRTKLGWTPKVSLDEGLNKVVTYWKEFIHQ